MASVPRAAWRRIKVSLADQVSQGVADRIESTDHELLDRLSHIESQLDTVISQLRELQQLGTIQVESANQSTEVFGRLLRSATSRLDELEGGDRA